MSRAVSFIVALGAETASMTQTVELLCAQLHVSFVDEIIVVHALSWTAPPELDAAASSMHVHREMTALVRSGRVGSFETTALCENGEHRSGHDVFYVRMKELVLRRMRPGWEVHLCISSVAVSISIYTLLVGATFLREEDGLWLMDIDDHSQHAGMRLHSLPIRPRAHMPEEQRERLRHFLEKSLTVRESEIVRIMVQSRLSNRQIALRLGITERRVEKILSEDVYPALRNFLGRAQAGRQDLIAEFAAYFVSDE